MSLESLTKSNKQVEQWIEQLKETKETPTFKKEHQILQQKLESENTW